MLKFLFQGLKTLFFLILTFFLGAVVCVLILLTWPQLLINSKTVGWVKQVAAHHGVELDWRGLDLHIHSHSLLSKELHLGGRDLCISVPKERILGCASHIDMTLGADFSAFRLNWTRVGPLEVQDLKWKVEQPDGRGMTGGLQLKAEPKSRLSDWKVQVEGDAQLLDRSRVAVQATLNLVHVPEFIGIRFNRAVRKIGIHYDVVSRYEQGKARAEVHGSGDLHFNEFSGRFSGRATQLVPQLPKIEIENCQLILRRNNRHELASTGGILTASCPMEIPAPLPPSGIALFHLPSSLKLLMLANVASSHFLPNPESRLKGDISVQLIPVENSLLHADGEAQLNLNFVPKEFPGLGTTNLNFHLKALFPEFQRLVFTLDRSDWAVPAPFHVLHGKAVAEVMGQSDLISGQVDLSARTRLSSKGQKLNLDGKGVYSFQRDEGEPKESALNFEVVLTDVQLEIPRLALGPPPRFVADSRFVSSRKKMRERRPFFFKGRIRTLPGHPARILSNLAQADVPVEVDLNLQTGSSAVGMIHVGNFPTQLFTREAQIVRFGIDLEDPAAESAIDGYAKIAYIDYTVFLRVIGTVDQPKLVLRSDPPLPENQLWAVLLFGHPMDELDPEQSASIGNTRSAIADGAIGLASLYLLASTPVESVSYDPGTNTFSAKIRLGEGVSLNLGRSGPESSFGIRKRLGPYLALETGMSTSSQGGQVGTIYLEWSRRY